MGPSDYEDEERQPICCPMCGSEDISCDVGDSSVLAILHTDDEPAEPLREHQCHECAYSFWTG